jgi:hypothetical protein
MLHCARTAQPDDRMMYWVSMRVDGAFVGAAIVNRIDERAAVDAAGKLAEPHLCDRHREIEMAIGAIPTGSPPIPPRVVERFLTYEQMAEIWDDLQCIQLGPDGRFHEVTE